MHTPVVVRSRRESVVTVDVVRITRFRTQRPAFDSVLRAKILPSRRAMTGVNAVFAGRQGPTEVGARILVTLCSEASPAARPEASHAGGAGPVPAPDDGTEAYEGTDGHEVEVLPVLALDLAPTPLTTGILRISRGRLGATDVATYAELVRRDLARHDIGRAGPRDFVVAGSGQGPSFTMISTWPDWAAIEEATGATIAEPLITKRLTGLDAFEVIHYELLTELPEPFD
jgi:hypothetical protein